VNILLINHYAGSIHHGMEFRPFYMAREWVRAGHNVQIVAASCSHVRQRPPVLDGEKSSDENISGIHYRWYKTPAYQGNGVRRVWNILKFLQALWCDGKRLAQDFRPDVVIASSTYPMDIWPAQYIARLAKARLVYEVHDLWPLSPIELGGMSRWNPFILWVQCAEDYAYRNADKVVSMLPKAKAYMQSRGMASEKFFHVPNGVDEEEWTQKAALPVAVAEEVKGLQAKNLPIVAYTGAHGVANALDALLDAAGQLNGKAQILLVGHGAERERLLSRVRNEKLNNVTMLPSIPKNAIPNLLGMVDILYIGIGSKNNSLFRFGISPNKLMDYMMAGKPIINAVDAGNDPVADARCGLTIPPGDAKSIVDAVINISEMPDDERIQMGQAGRGFILKHHTYRVLAKRFLDIASHG
jgi:glycosyltransferase involved in cell wall biosynthesis